MSILNRLWIKVRSLYYRVRNFCYLHFTDVVAQLAHFGWGAWAPLKLEQHGVPLLWAVHIPAAIFAAKETLESLGWAFWEPKQTWASSGIDYLFFVLGILSYYL